MFERKEKVTYSDRQEMIKAVEDNVHHIMSVARSIHNELAADSFIMEMHDYMDNMGDDIPTMLTISVDMDTDGTVDFNWQSGDNSYTGACYDNRFWGVTYFDPTGTPETYYSELKEDLCRVLFS